MRHGADVVITARNEGEVTAAAQAVTAAHAGRRAIGVVATASSAEDFERVYELTERELGPVGVVVNNAGNSTLDTIVNLFEDDWNLLVDTHLTHAVAHSLSERAVFYDHISAPVTDVERNVSADVARTSKHAGAQADPLLGHGDRHPRPRRAAAEIVIAESGDRNALGPGALSSRKRPHNHAGLEGWRVGGGAFAVGGNQVGDVALIDVVAQAPSHASRSVSGTPRAGESRGVAKMRLMWSPKVASWSAVFSSGTRQVVGAFSRRGSESRSGCVRVDGGEGSCPGRCRGRCAPGG